MRFVRIAFVLTALGAAGACAASGDEEHGSKPPSDSNSGDGGNTLLDAGAGPSNDGAADADASFEAPVCSEAGWCRTPLLEEDLVFKDVAMVGDRVFALVTSATVGTKVLEWDTDHWSYIDDKPQLTVRMTPSNLWASGEDEVFYSVNDYSGLLAGEGTYGVFVYRGTRPTPPATDWTWTRSRVECPPLSPAPHVWGTSSSDVYLAACGKMFHLREDSDADAGGDPDGSDAGDAGASVWTEEYVDADPVPAISFNGVTGTGPDDVWFVGYRGSSVCTVLVHKTAAGYEKIVDGTPGPNKSCLERSGLPTITGVFKQNQANFHAVAKDRFVGVRFSNVFGNDIVKVAPDGAGGWTIAYASPAPSMSVLLGSIWGTSEDDLWMIASSNISSGGFVVRGANIWSDAGTYSFSTLALNGAPNTKPLQKIRGTSNENLWAVGSERAYHKNTP